MSDVLTALSAVATKHPVAVANLIDAYENSFPGERGMTIVEKLTRMLDKAYKDFQECETEYEDNAETNEESPRFLEGYINGIAEALALMRSSSRDHELNKCEERYVAHTRR